MAKQRSSAPECSLLRKILGYVGLTIVRFKIQPIKGVLHLWVKPFRNGSCCPKCGRRCKLTGRSRSPRTWRDVPICGLSVSLHYRPREIFCPTHKKLQEAVPWATPKARYTLRLEYEVMRLCRATTQKEAAATLGLPKSTIADILHRSVDRLRDGHRIRGLKKVGIDEISYRKGHRYLTVVYDLERHHVVWVGKGRARDTIDRFFKEYLSPGQKKRIEVACCDMSPTYIGAIQEHLPSAKLVLDRFHVIKALNEAVDEVRKELWRSLDTTRRKELKGLRFILLKNAANRTDAERSALSRIALSHRRIYRATMLKDELSLLWENGDHEAAESFLKRWCKTALLSRIEPIRRFVATVKNHLDGILASICGVTNAVAEGLNRVIRMVKNRASGYRSTDNFSNMIYLVVGDLDLPAQIGKENRTRRQKVHTHRDLCCGV